MTRPGVVLLVNPYTGRGRATGVAAVAARRLRERNLDVRVVEGKSAQDAVTLLDRALTSTPALSAIVACGGDGTVHQALQCALRDGLALGIIPAGTGNDAARMLGLPKDPVVAADAIADALAVAPRLVDVGWVESSAGPRHAFLAVVSTGFDSLVNERANTLTWPRGQLRYLRAIVAELQVFKAVPYVFVLDEGTTAERVIHRRAMLVAVGNGPSYGGGMRVCPAATPDDGLLDITVLAEMPTGRFLRVFPTVYRGTHVTRPEVTTYTAHSVALSAPGQVAYADGERVGDLPVRITVAPDALHVLAPEPIRLESGG